MIELNEANFADSTKTGVAVVDFSAEWCGPCRLLAPTLANVKNANLFKVDVDHSPSLATQFHVSSIPCLVFLKDGVEQARLVGMQTLSPIQDQVDRLNAAV